MIPVPARQGPRAIVAALTAAAAVAGLAGTPLPSTAAVPTAAVSTARDPGPVAIVAAENEYGNVASQIGGPYVKVSSVESNPNTDPHTYEVSAGVAKEVAAAQLVIQNGVGYDDFMAKIESASPKSSREVIDVQHLLGLPDSTPNPHLWYKPGTMTALAHRLASDLSELEPAHAGYFKTRTSKFVASLKPWMAAMAKFEATYPNTPVATTEPVGDYMLEAAGTRNLTPFTLQAAIMNGTDPSPQNVSLQDGLFSHHKVKVFVYNQQVTDSLTASFLSAAKKARIPVVGVYETMPTPGFDYQSWMLAEVDALVKAVAHGTSTEKL